jgi:hypothetical protein
MPNSLLARNPDVVPKLFSVFSYHRITVEGTLRPPRIWVCSKTKSRIVFLFDHGRSTDLFALEKVEALTALDDRVRIGIKPVKGPGMDLRS